MSDLDTAPCLRSRNNRAAIMDRTVDAWHDADGESFLSDTGSYVYTAFWWGCASRSLWYAISDHWLSPFEEKRLLVRRTIPPPASVVSANYQGVTMLYLTIVLFYDSYRRLILSKKEIPEMHCTSETFSEESNCSNRCKPSLFLNLNTFSVACCAFLTITF